MDAVRPVAIEITSGSTNFTTLSEGDELGWEVANLGDWDGDGYDTVAVYRPSAGRIYVNLSNAATAADYTLFVGSYPVAATSSHS